MCVEIIAAMSSLVSPSAHTSAKNLLTSLLKKILLSHILLYLAGDQLDGGVTDTPVNFITSH